MEDTYSVALLFSTINEADRRLDKVKFDIFTK